MADKIVEGKKRKLSQANRRKQEWQKVKAGQADSPKDPISGNQKPDAQTAQEEPVIDRETVIQEEIDKIRDFPPQNVLIQTFNGENSIKYLSGYFSSNLFARANDHQAEIKPHI